MQDDINRNWPIVHFVSRWILGILFLMASYWKVFELSLAEHANRFFVEAYADSWIPEWLLNVLGLSIPLLELAASILLCVGWRIREALIALGLLLVITTYGHALQDPFFDIDGPTFTRLALIILLLLAPAGSAKYSLDGWLEGRKQP